MLKTFLQPKWIIYPWRDHRCLPALPGTQVSSGTSHLPLPLGEEKCYRKFLSSSGVSFGNKVQGEGGVVPTWQGKKIVALVLQNFCLLYRFSSSNNRYFFKTLRNKLF